MFLSWIAVAGAALLSFQDANQGVADPVKDPLAGSIADGSVKSLSPPPGLIHLAGSGPIVLLVSERIGDLPEGNPNEPRLVAYKDVIAAEGAVQQFSTLDAKTVIEQGVLKNPGPAALRVQIASTTGVTEFVLEPGFGLLVGDIQLAGPTHVLGCACTCTGNPDGVITVACPPAQGEDTCPCASLNNTPCQRADGTWGTSKDCRRALILAD